MILWTIQPIEVYNLIQEKGYYICDPSKSECLEMMCFEKAYDWLIEKMDSVAEREEFDFQVLLFGIIFLHF